VFLAALLVLPLWKGAHHVRSFSIDYGGLNRDPLVAALVYTVAAIGSLLAILAVVRL
jgi:fumarate reductase subunit D